MRPKIILSLVILLYLMACGPISCTPPTINVSCDEADLIAAINQANLGAGHNTLILDANCIYELITEDNFITDEDLPGIVGGTGLPPVSTPITIEGNNATIQRQVGAPNFRIFFVTGTGDLTLNDLSILNGAALEGNGHGGGIYVNGSILTMNNAHVDNNSAEYFGGGIYNDDEGTLTISNSSINFNQAMGGGGIQNNGGIVSIDGDSMINNNIANINGGGIISANGSNGELTILGGQVSNNQAGSSGGAISITGSVLTYLTLDGVLFEGNTTNGEGGAIAIADSTFMIMGSTFTNNQASGGTLPLYGGAIVVRDGGHGTIGDSLFDGNYSGEFGGAISNQISGGTISIYETTIQNNSAEVSGGGIYNLGNLFISNSTITANTALTYMGGGVFNQNGGLIIQDSTISDNSSASQGGGVSVNNSTLTISGSTFQGNQTSTSGGGLSTVESPTTIGGGSIFDGNTAQSHGGGIYNGQDSVMTLEDSIVSNNQALTVNALGGGGGIYNFSLGTMTISTTTISGNTSGYAGGGVVTNGVMWITQSTINNNTAANEGGGIRGYNLTLINSTVSENHSDGLAGGVYAGSNTAIISSTIVHNTSSSSPSVGGLFTFPNNMIKNSIIAMNTPKDCWLQNPPNVVGNNLDSDGTCTGFTITTDPLIGPLADNGGPTWTHALLTGSPALDAVTDCTDHTGTPLTFDQRFASRPGGPECDLGAYEDSNIFVPPPPMIRITPPPSVYWCVDILGVTILEGGKMRIQVETSGLPDGIYTATVGKYDFTCKTYPEYPDRLFCDGPKGEGGTLTTLTIFDPLGTLFCEETFTIPVKDVPEEPSNCSKYTTSATCTADPKCTWDSRSGPCEEK